MMYYADIHDKVRKAAAEQGISIESLLKAHGISKPTYYWRLRYGTSWKTSDLKALSDITGISTADLLENYL